MRPGEAMANSTDAKDPPVVLKCFEIFPETIIGAVLNGIVTCTSRLSRGGQSGQHMAVPLSQVGYVIDNV